jgi:AcrR family transcriptional regulator
MISEKVGVSKSTIIHHFNSKEGILLAILEQHVPNAGRDIEILVKNDRMKGINKLKGFIQRHLQQVHEHGDIINLNLRETRYFNSKNRNAYMKMQHAYFQSVRNIIIQIQKEEKKLFRNLDANIVTLAILGMLNSIPQWYKKDGRLSIEEITNHIFRLITKD